MRTKEFFGKEILNSDIRIIGKVHDVIFDEDTFEITDLVIKKIGISEQFKSTEDLIPSELVKSVGDKILLKDDDDI